MGEIIRLVVNIYPQIRKNMSKKVISTLVFLVIAGVIVSVIVFASGSSQANYSNSTDNNSNNNIVYPPPTNTTGNTNTTGSNSTVGAKTYTLAQVATHSNSKSCWTTINGGVYDVTSWISQHPGGEQAILSICGIDGSTAFNNQHGGQSRPESELASFKIGTLVK